MDGHGTPLLVWDRWPGGDVGGAHRDLPDGGVGDSGGVQFGERHGVVRRREQGQDRVGGGALGTQLLCRTVIHRRLPVTPEEEPFVMLWLIFRDACPVLSVHSKQPDSPAIECPSSRSKVGRQSETRGLMERRRYGLSL